MGVGKSTVGPLVAARLGLPWWDLDLRVEQRVGCSVSTLFREHGESVFREVELEALRAGLGEGPAVVSLGGGALLTPGAIRLVNDAGMRCVVLQARWTTIAARLEGSERPLMGEARVRFEARREHYRGVGEQVATDGMSPAQVTDRVVELVRRWQ